MGYFGSLNFAKLHPHYVDFLAAVDKPGLTVRLIGDLTNRDILERQSALIGREGMFEFRGYSTDIAAELKAINVLAYLLNPEHYGTTENALLEAMAVGIVPIVLDNPAERHIIEDNRTGLIVSTPSEFSKAVYWLAKMLKAGEDIRFIARRIVIFASEDIGNADPAAIQLATAAMQAVEMIGMPEAKLILSQAVTYCATAPKSNASCVAITEALDDIEHDRLQPVPLHLRDSHYSGAKKMGHGEGYQYPHNHEGNFVVQEYMGVRKTYYRPSEWGHERKIRERLEYWRGLRGGEGQAVPGTGAADSKRPTDRSQRTSNNSVEI